MKKKILIALLLLFVSAFIYKVWIDGSHSDNISASFAFDENLTVITQKEAKIEIKIDNQDLRKVELKLNDSILQVWDSPKGDVFHILKTSFMKLGTNKLVLISTLNDNTTETEERDLKILNDKKPVNWKLDVVKEYTHRDSSYTQGLEFSKGQLYEGTGDPSNQGNTLIAKIEQSSGRINKKVSLDATYFGEGITILNDTLYQLTWRNEKCFIYNADNLAKYSGEFQYKGEGWGLCNDGENLIMSNGTEQLVFRNPRTFEIVKIIEATTNEGSISQLNELEYIDGKIYANIYMQDLIAVINPKTGAVEAIIQANDIVAKYRASGEVLNGIAFNSEANELVITGKYWNKLLSVKIIK
ncbi:MAG: glutaminyl-peptide cyclotransferase [Bacteroidetes bacterium]|nr:glutaminyl-peptide cyclotransferase [Bacteroidota bacterium]